MYIRFGTDGYCSTIEKTATLLANVFLFVSFRVSTRGTLCGNLERPKG
jgi:hypothetical protein